MNTNCSVSSFRLLVIHFPFFIVIDVNISDRYDGHAIRRIVIDRL